MVENKFPPGWDEQRVQSVLAHYQAQSDDEAVAEDETDHEESRQTAMEVIGATDMGPTPRVASRGDGTIPSTTSFRLPPSIRSAR